MKLFRNYLKKLTTPTTQTNFNINEDVTDEEYTFDVVGESFQRDHLVQIIKNTKSADLGEIYTTATLKLEPENPFDSSAVMVIINDLHVGYIPKSQSGMMTDHIQSKGGNTLEVPARIGWDTESPQPLVGVRLKMEIF
jgi:hypothetical protein